jgi:hypothetical protein
MAVPELVPNFCERNNEGSKIPILEAPAFIIATASSYDLIPPDAFTRAESPTT